MFNEYSSMFWKSLVMDQILSRYGAELQLIAAADFSEPVQDSLNSIIAHKSMLAIDTLKSWYNNMAAVWLQ